MQLASPAVAVVVGWAAGDGRLVGAKAGIAHAQARSSGLPWFKA